MIRATAKIFEDFCQEFSKTLGTLHLPRERD